MLSAVCLLKVKKEKVVAAASAESFTSGPVPSVSAGHTPPPDASSSPVVGDTLLMDETSPQTDNPVYEKA